MFLCYILVLIFLITDCSSDSKKRNSKRNMQRLRGSERDLKLNINVSVAPLPKEETTESLPTIKVFD